jgi:hypothetical protein
MWYQGRGDYKGSERIFNNKRDNDEVLYDSPRSMKYEPTETPNPLKVRSRRSSVSEVESEDLDVVAESTKKLAGQAGEHNLISENLKKDLASFNKIINYKY